MGVMSKKNNELDKISSEDFLERNSRVKFHD